VDNALIYSVNNRTPIPARSRAANADSSLDPDEPALSAITDFVHEYAFTVRPDLSINDALITMICAGVHALVVTQEASESPEQLVMGLVTTQAIEAVLRKRHPLTDAMVRDVMTPWIDLPLIHVASLQSLTVHDLYERFQGTGLTHFLIVESVGHDHFIARGLVSRAAVARRLRGPREVAA
jgi:CBS domain-containing protein